MQITCVDETRLGALHEVSADWQRGVPGQVRVTVAAIEAGEWHGAPDRCPVAWRNEERAADENVESPRPKDSAALRRRR